MIQPGIYLRLLGGLLLTAILPLTILQQVLTERFGAEMQARITHDLSVVADHKAEQIASLISRQSDNVVLLAKLPATLQALREARDIAQQNGLPGLHLREQHELRTHYLTSIGWLTPQAANHDLLLIDAQGDITLSSQQDVGPGANLLSGPLRNSPLARAVQRSLLGPQSMIQGGISDFGWHPVASGHSGFITTPVVDANRVVGVLAIQIATAPLRQLLQEINGLGKTGTIQLAQQSGQPPRIVTSIDSSGDSSVADSLFSDHLPQLAITQSLPLMRALAGEHGQGEALDYRQTPVLAAWRYIAGPRWGLVVKMDTEEAFAPVRELQRQAHLLLLASLLLALAIAFWLGRSIVRPVRKLTDAASQIAAGNLQQRVPVSRHDEIGQLADAFNTMADSLAHTRQALHTAHDSLETKVEQRTEALAWEKERMHTILDNMPNGIVSFTAEGAIESFNKSAERIFGCTAADAIGMHIQQLAPEAMALAPDDPSNPAAPPEHSVARFKAAIGSGREIIAHRSDGAPFSLQISLSETHLGNRHMFIASVQDVSEIRRAESTLRLYASVFEHSGEAMMICDAVPQILAVNPAFTLMNGYSIEEIIGIDPRTLTAEDPQAPLHDEIREALRGNGFWQGEMRHRRKDGRIYTNWVSISVVHDSDGSISHYLMSYLDITERKAVEERIAHQAHHDMLTGLLNRLSLSSRLEQALARARREEHPLAVLFLDMDRFKAINDTLGHAAGDKLLIDVARRLGEIVRDSDIVARLGGDEFVVVLTEVESTTAAARVTDKILQTLGQPYLIDGHTVRSTPSIGAAFFPSDGADSTTLMKNADTAMYHAKSKGRNNIQFFAPEMNTLANERLRMEHQLHEALAERQFELHYQPRLDGNSGHFVSVEALLRWRHPTDGLLTPEHFITIAEESGQILPIGEWVIDEACRQLRAWRDQGLHGIGMTLNISARQLYSPTLPDHLGRALQRHDLKGADLEVEISETILMSAPETSIDRLYELRNVGVRLSIDNFGTSSSSLHYLQQMPIGSLNIDQSLVRNIDSEVSNIAICNATISLAHHLGMRVVAEGVETEAQREFLIRQRCDFMQGYLFGKPQSAAALSSLMQRQLH